MAITSTFGALRGPLVDGEGRANWDFLKWLQKLEAKTNTALTILGSITATTKIQGRSEGIATTVAKLNPAGLLKDADQVAADGVAFVRVNPNQALGGGRGFIALDSNSRLANSFRANAVNVSGVPTSVTVLSNNGVSTAIPVAASANKFAAGNVSYNPGSVDPGAFGTFFVFADDPTFAGGAVIYQFSASAPDQVGAEGRIPFGKITTVGGTAKTGGGNTGGTTSGGAGGRGYALA